MKDDLETLLKAPLLQPPADFTARVMQRLTPLRRHEAAGAQLPVRLARWQHLRWWIAATGVIGGGILGLIQIAAFVFGLWVTAAAV